LCRYKQFRECHFFSSSSSSCLSVSLSLSLFEILNKKLKLESQQKGEDLDEKKPQEKTNGAAPFGTFSL
jgi:hypothetical protein